MDGAIVGRGQNDDESMVRAIAVIDGAETPLGIEIARRLISENFLVAAITTATNNVGLGLEARHPGRFMRLSLNDESYEDILLRTAQWGGHVRIVISVSSQEHFLSPSGTPGMSTKQHLASVSHTVDLLFSAGRLLRHQNPPVRLLAVMPPSHVEEAGKPSGIIEASLRQMTRVMAKEFRGQGTAINLVIANRSLPRIALSGHDEADDSFPDTVGVVSQLSSAEDPWFTGLTIRAGTESGLTSVRRE